MHVSTVHACDCHVTSHVPQGSSGMRYSLISRDWVADCVEIMHEAYYAVSSYIYASHVTIM